MTTAPSAPPERLVLASGSPRRRDLLSALGIPFRVEPSQADETLPAEEPLKAGLRAVALRKAREVAARASGEPWILAADTAVVAGSRVLGKPRGPEEAEGMLRDLSGRSHRVITAVALVGSARERTFAVETRVTFRTVAPRAIRWYASTDEPYDKAGGYAIQGRGAFLVERIRGSYTNVVGLPMAEVTSLLEEIGLAPWIDRVPREGTSG